jgi:aminodeoxyfutalosine deaminase
MFSTSLNEEFRRCAAAFGWDAAQVRALAAASVRHSFMPEAAKLTVLEEQSRVAAEILGDSTDLRA